jgi:hypothetical protein
MPPFSSRRHDDSFVTHTASSSAQEPTAEFVSRTSCYDGHSTILEIARQRYPAFEAVIQRFRDGRSLRHKLPLGDHPGMKCVDDRRCFFLPYSLPDTRFQLTSLSFYFVQRRDLVHRFFGDLTLVGRVKVEELPACMGHAADLRDT